MNEKRLALFLIGCVGTRIMLVYLAKTRTDLLPYMAIIAFLIAFGFMYFYLTGTRTTGPEVFGEKIWWNNLRPVHASLYFIFALFALQKNKNAFWILLIDVILGLVATLHKRLL
jgi:hypothetical protein